MADSVAAVFPTVASLPADFFTPSGRSDGTFHSLPSLSARTRLCRERLARRTRARVTEHITAVWTMTVPRAAAEFTAAVRSRVLVVLRVLQLTCTYTHTSVLPAVS